MPEVTENFDLIVAAQEAVNPYAVEQTNGSGIYLVRDEDGGTIHLDLREQLGLLPTTPARKTGQLVLTEVDSYIGALTKHALPQTELLGDTKAGTIRAVINAHGEASGDPDDHGTPGWADHTITLRLPKTTDWTDWTARDGHLIDQAAFAEFIEDHLPNFVTPTGADMLELAQTFRATTKVDFESSQRIATGETRLVYKEDTNAAAGKRGDLAIPDTFELALQPFERGQTYRVQARFRYRIDGGQLQLGYRLTRLDDVLRDAFDHVITAVQEGTDRTVWHAG